MREPQVSWLGIGVFRPREPALRWGDRCQQAEGGNQGTRFHRAQLDAQQTREVTGPFWALET